MKVEIDKKKLWCDSTFLNWYEKPIFRTTKITFNDSCSFIWLHWQYGDKATKSLISLRLTNGVIKIWRFEFQYQNYYMYRLIFKLRKKFNYWK
jgi:hypothetical protein